MKIHFVKGVLLIITILFSQLAKGQDILGIENYLLNKYPCSNTISNTKSQYIFNSIKSLNDTTLAKYIKNVDFFKIEFRTVICWMVDNYKSILISDKKAKEYYLIHPLDLFSTDSIAVSFFEQKLIEDNDRESYCCSFANLFASIGFFPEPQLDKLEKISHSDYKISYSIILGNRRKIYRNIHFIFDKSYLQEIKIINPYSGMNYKDYSNE